MEEKKKGLIDILNKAAEKAGDVGSKIDSATDELNTIRDDAKQDFENSTALTSGSLEPEDLIKQFTARVSVQANYYKEKKGIYDQIEKMDD